MNVSADTWYRIGELFDAPSAQLKDGSSIRCSSAQFRGSTIRALTGTTVSHHGREAREPGQRYQYLQLTMHNVDRTDLDRLPAPISMSSQLLRENVLYLPESSYAYDLLIRNNEQTYYSNGAVCMELMLDDEHPSAQDSRRKSREVAEAHRSGLLDDAGKSKADFRLQIKPAMRKLTALLDSGHLPGNESQVDVLFSHWYEQRTNELVLTPVGSDEDPSSLEHLEIQLVRHTRRRAFRITDLFKDEFSR